MPAIEGRYRFARRLAFALLTFLAWPGTVAAQTPAASATAPLRLPDLERMALERNPTLPQARASVRAAEGRQSQAGIYPNPLIGYELDDLNTREPGRNKNFFWFQVPIVTAPPRTASGPPSTRTSSVSE
jgi:outer membrane protein TolC